MTSPRPSNASSGTPTSGGSAPKRDGRRRHSSRGAQVPRRWLPPTARHWRAAGWRAPRLCRGRRRQVITIGVDAREILGDTTGVGRYLSELLTRWTSRADASTRRFILFAPGEVTLPLSRDHVETRVLPAAHGGTWWEQTTLRQAVGRERLDRFFAPAYTAPLGLTIPLALTIHDVSFLAHPEWFRPRERLRRRWLTKQSARSAAVVLTDSVFSRDEIVKHTGARRRAGADHPAGRQRAARRAGSAAAATRAAGAVRRDVAESPAGSPARSTHSRSQPRISRTRAWSSSAPIAPGRPRTSAPSRRGSASRAKSRFAATSATPSWRRSTRAHRYSFSCPNTKASA